MGESDFQAVKIFMKNEMFPRYNFLRRRLFSIYPRFKDVIELGKLNDLIPDGRKRLDQIEAAKDKLQATLSVYITGHHTSISLQQIKSDFLVSSKGTEDFSICKTPVCEEEFRESIRNISEVPAVIVHVEKVENGSAEEVFMGASNSLVSKIPPMDRYSAILCSDTCKQYASLEEFNFTNNLAEVDSLGKQIQACLEGKVVKVLKQMSEFIQLYLPTDRPKGCHGNEPLACAVKSSLESAVNENNLNKELTELGTKRDLDSSMVWYLCRNLETKICEILSAKHKIRPNIVHEFLYKTDLVERIKVQAEEYPRFYDKNTVEITDICEDFLQNISEDLDNFEDQAEATLSLISGVLSKIEFEINGVFRQAKMENCLVPAIPRHLQAAILSMEGVHGCGFVYGKLVVHIKENTHTNVKEIIERISALIRNLHKVSENNFVIKQVSSSFDAGLTYESGKSLRVRKDTALVDSGDILTTDKHSYGTLGCFVKGKMSASDSENYSSQMYALSSAHVFPEGCENCIEVGRTCEKFDRFGIVSPEMTLLKEHIIDIAAIVVEESVKEKCNTHLKNCDGFEGWGSILHEGNFKELIGMEVYKWGSASDLTHGLIVSVDYQSTHGVETLDEDYNILIQTLPQMSESDFSSKGDSGTVVCFEDPVEEKVVALSMISGALYDKKDNKYISTYSCHLHTNIQELSKTTNINFEWYS